MPNTEQFKGSIPLNGKGASCTILLRFFLTREEALPPGIPEKQPRLSSMAREVVRQRMDVGRGMPVIENMPLVRVEALRQGLSRHSFVLTDVHYMVKERQGKKTQFILNLSFEKNGTATAELSAEAETMLRDLAANITWEWAHVWSNPSGVGVINLIGRREYDTPNFELVAEGGVLRAYELEDEQEVA